MSVATDGFSAMIRLLLMMSRKYQEGIGDFFLRLVTTGSGVRWYGGKASEASGSDNPSCQTHDKRLVWPLEALPLTRFVISVSIARAVKHASPCRVAGEHTAVPQPTP
jgi:hypothetical protein